MDAAPIPLFLTLGIDDCFAGMVDDQEARHRAYCAKHGYEYRAVTDGKFTPWRRMTIVLDAMKSGRYSHIFCLDADAFVANLYRDMRETLPEWSWIAMSIRRGHHRHYEHWYLQNGVMYLRVCKESIDCVSSMLERAKYFFDEREALNFMLVHGAEASTWARGLRVLPFQWNCLMHEAMYDPGDPIVGAVHGYLDPWLRRLSVADYASRYPWTQ